MKIENFKYSNLFAPQVSAWGVLRSGIAIATKRLSGVLEGIEGIRTADPNGISGDGNDIRAKLNANGLHEITLSRGWGDCAAGCIRRTFWKFEMQTDGSVVYIGQSGD